MRQSWMKLYLAALLEVGWVVGLAHAYDWLTWTLTLLLIIVSNYLLVVVAKVLPTGTVYAVFVGLGTVGTVIAGVVFFQESISWIKVLLIGLLLAGVLGLKLLTIEKVAADEVNKANEDTPSPPLAAESKEKEKERQVDIAGGEG